MADKLVVPRPTPGDPPIPRVPEAVRWTLPNGLRVVAVERRELPQVAVRFVVRAGSVADPPGRRGLASLTSSLLLEGTAGLDPLDFHRKIDSLGATIDTRTGHDFTEVDLGLLAETLFDGLGLLRELLAEPRFPQREIDRVRAETLDALEAREDEPANVADDLAAEGVYGANHPYGQLTMGTAETVSAITRDDIIAFHADHFGPEDAFLIVVGELGGDGGRRTIEDALGGWSGGSVPVNYPEATSAAVAAGRMVNIGIEGSPQAELRLAGGGMRRSDPDWIRAAVANFILGGSTITGRLGANIREDKGWTYGVRSGFSAGILPGGWTVETAVDAEVATAAMDEIVAEVNRITSEPVSDDELQRAREALILSLPRAFETPGRIVARLATVEAYGLPENYWSDFPLAVREVTADDVLEVARRYFDPHGLVRVVVGPELTPPS